MTASASPRVAAGRLAESVSALLARVEEPEIRAQLHALASLLESLGSRAPDESERAPLEHAIATALQDADEDAAIQAMRRLAALDRSGVGSVDWSAASGG